MNSERYKQKMAELEKELDAHIARLTPESRQEFKQKQNEFNQDEDISNIRFAVTSGPEKSGKNNWTSNI